MRIRFCLAMFEECTSCSRLLRAQMADERGNMTCGLGPLLPRSPTDVTNTVSLIPGFIPTFLARQLLNASRHAQAPARNNSLDEEYVSWTNPPAGTRGRVRRCSSLYYFDQDVRVVPSEVPLGQVQGEYCIGLGMGVGKVGICMRVDTGGRS